MQATGMDVARAGLEGPRTLIYFHKLKFQSEILKSFKQA